MRDQEGRSPVDVLMRALGRQGRCNLIARELAGIVGDEELQRDQSELAEYLAANDIRHERKIIPFEILPYVLTQRTYQRVTETFRRVSGLIERVIDLYLTEPEVRDFFRLAPRHDRLIRMGTPYRPHVQYCRFDFTIAEGGVPRIYELNTHCPAAATYGHHFGRLLERSRVMDRLRDLGLRAVRPPLERPGAFARDVLASAERAGFLGEDRTVAVLNSRYLTMHTELDHIAEQFRDQGCRAVRCFVEDLRFDGTTLRFADTPVHLTYNKFDDSRGPDAFECAFSRTTAEVADYIAAYRDGAVFAVNGFPSMYLPEQKATLAFLHSPLMREHTTADERALIEQVVPHTRLVRHLDAAELAEAERDRRGYVLKQSLDTRGRSVVLGCDTSPDEWRRALADARARGQGDDYVIQELDLAECSVRPDTHPERPARTFTSLACFLFGGAPTGLIVRTSAEKTTNVGRTGFMQPPLVVEEPAWTSSG